MMEQSSRHTLTESMQTIHCAGLARTYASSPTHCCCMYHCGCGLAGPYLALCQTKQTTTELRLPRVLPESCTLQNLPSISCYGIYQVPVCLIIMCIMQQFCWLSGKVCIVQQLGIVMLFFHAIFSMCVVFTGVIHRDHPNSCLGVFQPDSEFTSEPLLSSSESPDPSELLLLISCGMGNGEWEWGLAWNCRAAEYPCTDTEAAYRDSSGQATAATYQGHVI